MDSDDDNEWKPTEWSQSIQGHKVLLAKIKPKTSIPEEKNSERLEKWNGCIKMKYNQMKWFSELEEGEEEEDEKKKVTKWTRQK